MPQYFPGIRPIRYEGPDSKDAFARGLGATIENRRATFADLEAFTRKNGEPRLQSGRQELLEGLLNEAIE